MSRLESEAKVELSDPPCGRTEDSGPTVTDRRDKSDYLRFWRVRAAFLAARDRLAFVRLRAARCA